MTMTLDSVPAKLNELDLRAPLEVFEAIEAAIRERADLWSKWQAERCFRAKAEAELAALKARIAEAPIVMPLYAGNVHSDVPMTLVVTAPVASEWRGKRVRLLVED